MMLFALSSAPCFELFSAAPEKKKKRKSHALDKDFYIKGEIFTRRNDYVVFRFEVN